MQIKGSWFLFMGRNLFDKTWLLNSFLDKRILPMVVFISLLSVYSCFAQENGLEDYHKIKVPVIKMSGPDTARSIFPITYDLQADENNELKVAVKVDSLAVPLNLLKSKSLVSEDSSYLDEYSGVIEIAEELRIDCVWVTSQEYYSIWDSNNVNPYQIDGTKFSDTLSLVLYNLTNDLKWAAPLQDTRITSNFGMRSYRWHYGTDLKLNMGDTVRAAFDGIVRITRYDGGGYGNYIMLRHHNGLETLYGHLSKTLVDVGQTVKAGEVIGLGGSTGRSSGPHLHYEVRYQGNPLNPLELYNFEENQLLFDTLLITPQSFAYLNDARKVIYHKIRSGDTLGAISRRYRISINTLCRLNGISSKAILRIGRRLRVR